MGKEMIAVSKERIDVGDYVEVYEDVEGNTFIRRARKPFDLSVLNEFDIEMCFLSHQHGQDDRWRVKHNLDVFLEQLRNRVEEVNAKKNKGLDLFKPDGKPKDC